jgi:uncharacterized protein (DUF1697 family)
MAAKTPGKSVVRVALLRGVNLGPNNRLPMAELKSLFEECACNESETYIQSGNVVFEAKEKLLAGLEARLAKKIEERFGCRVPVLLRSREQLDHVLRNNPFAKADVENKILHVVFLAAPPGPDLIAKLQPERSPPDEFRVAGCAIYLRLPNGGAKSKLTTGYFDSRLKTVSTVRNWRTVGTLAEMLSQREKVQSN